MFNYGFPKEWSTIKKLIWLRAMQGGGLPEEIERAKYIQSAGGAYIVTNAYLSGDSTVIMDVEFTNNTAGNVFGCYKSTSTDNNFSVYRSVPGGDVGKRSYVRYNGQLYRNTDLTTERHKILMNSSGLFVDGAQTDEFTPSTFTSDQKLYIGALANSSAAKLTGKIFGFTAKGLFDGIPAKRLVNGSYEVGLYDRIGKQFYPSNGEPFTGE